MASYRVRCSGPAALTHVLESTILIAMSQRLQVLMDDKELREIRRIARRERLSVAEWVRRALRKARREAPESSVRYKQEAIDAALTHAFPTADIDAMLEEIERGYRDSSPE